MAKKTDKQEIEAGLEAIRDRHELDQAVEDFEAYFKANIAWIVDDVVDRVLEPRAPRVVSPMQKLASAARTFQASFDGAYQALMDAMFPMLALGSTARIGTRSGTAGAEAPHIPPVQPRALTPAQEEARASLPAWVVVPYAGALLPGTEFAILWAGEGAAPDLPPLELRLDGQPKDGNVFWSDVKTNLPGLPPGDVTFVQFDRLTPAAFTITAREDGTLVLDFATT